MKVKELIQKLQRYDPEYEVVFTFTTGSRYAATPHTGRKEKTLFIKDPEHKELEIYNTDVT